MRVADNAVGAGRRGEPRNPFIRRRNVRRFVLILLVLSVLAAWGTHPVYADGRRYVSVYLDPHYGGRDNGPAIGNSKGKDITLAIAKAIRQELADNNIQTHLSREDDVYIPRGDRWFFAKKKGADLYLSIRLRLQDRDCVQLYAGRSLGNTAPNGSTYEDLTKESDRLSALLSKSVRATDPPRCSVVQTKKDVIFETADFPAVIMEFGISATSRKHAYVSAPAEISALAKSIAAAIKEFMEARQP